LKELPTRLIGIHEIETNNFEEIKAEKTKDLIEENTKIKNYAALSYV